MPNLQSAKKALRQSKRRRARNLVRKKKIKEVTKKYKRLIEKGKKEEAKTVLPEVYKTLDKMAKVKFIKENKARRVKSKLASKLNK